MEYLVVSTDGKLMYLSSDNDPDDRVKTKINTEYQEYIKQLEDEVKELRIFIRTVQDCVSYKYDREDIEKSFPPVPPQTPEWRG